MINEMTLPFLYDSDLFRYRSDLPLDKTSEIILSRINSEKPTYLGSGTMQSAWLLPDDRVLKVTSGESFFKELSESKRIADSEFPWSKYEPKIFRIEKVSSSVFFVIMEKFLTLRKEDFGEDVCEDILSVSTDIENYLERFRPFPFTDEFDFETFRKLVCDFIDLEVLSFYRESLDLIGSFFSLNEGWENLLVEDVIYKTMTGREGDFFYENPTALYFIVKIVSCKKCYNQNNERRNIKIFQRGGRE